MWFDIPGSQGGLWIMRVQIVALSLANFVILSSLASENLCFHIWETGRIIVSAGVLTLVRVF